MTPKGNSLKVLETRYFLRDKEGTIKEDWEGLCYRVANEMAQAEETDAKKEFWRDKFNKLLLSGNFLPNSPAISNSGLGQGGLAACYVLPIEDNMKSIMETAKNAALIHKAGGGTGFSFSKLRPANSIVSKTCGVASGPVSFMKMYNAITEAIKQGGRRRGANMGILSIDHPDIIEFIDCKQDTSQIKNFNISVAITDKFMEALENKTEYDLIDPSTKKVVKSLPALDVWERICKNAWRTGEPGLFFIDVTNKAHGYKWILATNPCGEVPLLDNETCDLGSFNLYRYVKHSCRVGDIIVHWEDNINWVQLDTDVRIATRFLDNLIDRNNNPEFQLPEICEATLDTRKLGLGVMGFADALIKMGIRYGSKESFKCAEGIQQRITAISHQESKALGSEKGRAPACEKLGIDRRNFWCTIIAPTGTISRIAGCSSGIEPLFNVAYKSRVMDTELIDVNSVFKEMMGDKLTKSLLDKILTRNSIKNIEEIPKHIRELFVVTADIPVNDHIDMQAIFQKYVDGAVSKTINMPKDATIYDVRQAYERAYKSGCKGTTVYRDGCRENQVLSNEKPKTTREDRPMRTTGFTEKVDTGLGKLYLTINHNGVTDLPIETFARIAKSSIDIESLCDAIARLISISLQNGVSVKQISSQLKGIKGDRTFFHDKQSFSSIPDFIGTRLEGYSAIKERGTYAPVIQTQADVPHKLSTLQPKCPECGSIMIKREGCESCQSCSYSRC